MYRSRGNFEGGFDYLRLPYFSLNCSRYDRSCFVFSESDGHLEEEDYSNFRPAILKRNMAAISKKASPRNDAKFMCVFCTMSPHICDPLRACYPSFFMPSNS